MDEQPTNLHGSVPRDTKQTRTLHLRALATNPWVLSLTLTAAVLGFVLGASQADPGLGAIVAGGVLVAAALIAFVVASSLAREEFFAAYAAGHGLNRVRKGSLPETTPLLRKGDKRYAEQIMNGTLPSGLDGALGLYTYEEESRDSDGNTQTSYYRFTVVMHELPAVARRIAELHCERRSGFRWTDSLQDTFKRMKRLELESVALDKRYEIFFGGADDERWLHRLFSPSFIVWLADEAPKGMAFELTAGSLCVNVKGHHDSAAELDEVCVAAGAVARRLADEAAE